MDGIVIARWTEAPYTSYDRRGDVIQHRVVLEHYDGMAADVRHEARSDGCEETPTAWTEVAVWELRDYGLHKVSGKIDPMRD